MDLTALSYNGLLKNLKIDASDFKSITIAVLAEFASQHLVKALRGSLISYRINASIWEADYNAVDGTIFNDDAEFYQRKFDYIVILPSRHKLHKEFQAFHEKSSFAEYKLRYFSSLVAKLQARTTATIIIGNYEVLGDGVFGNYANKTTQSFLYQIRKINYQLMGLAVSEPNLFISDVEILFAQNGTATAFDAKLYIHGDLIYTLDFMALVAQNISKIIVTIQGNFKKCVICDLDNTLWGGIIGDDGIEHIQIGDLGLGKAFSELQNWLLQLKNRGIILAVCSKNSEKVAKEAFEKHPGMSLKLDDISVFVANWETKVDNIYFIQSVLNIGFDSMVFLDDNPFERGIIKKNVPNIAVPDLPEDPAEYLPYLQSLNLFETASFSEEDTKRTKQYQEEAGRMELMKSFANEEEFLLSLNMQALVNPLNGFTRPRVAQLTQRSNQFNLRTVRYTEADLQKLMDDCNFMSLTVSLTDIYGDYGLISTVFLEKKNVNHLFIDTWIMSCRVLKRGVEALLLNEIVALATKNGFSFIIGEYIPTAKNSLVKEHYIQLGFESTTDPRRFILDVKKYSAKKHHITKSIDYVNYE